MNKLKILVCIKQVPDPEYPETAYRVDSEEKKVIPLGIPPVISPYDENALEAALSIKDRLDATVTAMSMGSGLSLPVLRKALAAGADEMILLKDPNFEDLDNYSTAYVLSTAIEKTGKYDLILAGRQAADWDYGVTGLLIAAMLKIPSVSFAQRLEITGEGVFVEKLLSRGYEKVQASFPILVTVSSEIGELRRVSIKGLQLARKKPTTQYSADDLSLDQGKLRKREILKLVAPEYKRECKMIEGESAHEKVDILAALLQKDGII